MKDRSRVPYAAGVMVLVKPDGSVLLGHRTDGLWGLPGGKVDVADCYAEGAALRELQEETGLELDADDNDYLGSTVNEFPGYCYLTIAYGQFVSPYCEVRVCEPEKCREWRWFTLGQFPTPLLASTASLLPAIAGYIEFNRRDALDGGTATRG